VQADGAATATAGHAAGTGTAHNATVAIVATAGHAAGTGSAHSATVDITPAVGHAAGTGTAHDATVAIVASAGHASGTGTAHQPTVSATGAGDTTASAGQASGSGRAYDPVIIIRNARPHEGWAQLAAILRAARAERASAFDAERLHCPECGIAFDANTHGELGCRFDGRRAGTLAGATSGASGRDWGGLRAAMDDRRVLVRSDDIPGWGPTH
jgi:hypothetical protein